MDQPAAPDDAAVAASLGQSKPDRRKAIIGIGIMIVVAVIVFGVIFPQLVDWNLVFDVIGEVDGADLALLLVLALVRYIPSGWIYAIVLPGLSVRNGTRAWVATTGVGSTLPGFDLVLRLAMYSSWGFSIERATSGMFLSGIVEMSTKLAIAVFAIAAWGAARADLDSLAVAAIGAGALLVAGTVVGLVLRSEERARQFGRFVERVVRWGFRRFARQAPDDIVDRVLSVRLEAREVLGQRWPQAFLAAGISQLIVLSMLILALRSVGVESSTLSWTDILFVQALVTLITTIPISPGNLGVAEIAYVALFGALTGGDEIELITAGVILFRLALWFVPIPVGWIVTLRWQSTSGMRMFGGSGSPAPSS